MIPTTHKVIIGAIMGIILIAGIGFFAYSQQTKPIQKNPSPFPAPQRTTLTGTYLCLPNTNTSGPQTLECALGIQTDTGIYYAMDFNLLSTITPDIPTGSRISANGIVTPIEQLSSDHWKKYPVTGIFSVTDSLVIQ